LRGSVLTILASSWLIEGSQQIVSICFQHRRQAMNSKKGRRFFMLALALLNGLLMTTIIIVILLIGGLGAALFPLRTYGKPLEGTGDNLRSGLAHLQPNSLGSLDVINRPDDERGRLSLDRGNDSTIASPTVPLGCEALGMHASPRGPWLALQVSCESRASVQVINTATWQIRDFGVDFGGDSTFLSWSPNDSRMILKVDILTSPRVFLVDVANGRADNLPVPETTYDVAISRDG